MENAGEKRRNATGKHRRATSTPQENKKNAKRKP